MGLVNPLLLPLGYVALDLLKDLLEKELELLHFPNWIREESVWPFHLKFETVHCLIIGLQEKSS